MPVVVLAAVVSGVFGLAKIIVSGVMAENSLREAREIFEQSLRHIVIAVIIIVLAVAGIGMGCFFLINNHIGG